jgi:hypothetical protein
MGVSSRTRPTKPNKMTTVLRDGFLWMIVTNKAKAIFDSNLFELYVLCNDGTEFLIDDIVVDMDYAKTMGYEIGIEIGFVNEII